MIPKLKLVIDVKADIQNAKWFLKDSDFFAWFLPSDLQYVRTKNFSVSEKKKIITEYTKYFFKTHEKEISDGVARTRKSWSKIEGRYYKLLAEIFHNHPWPKGKYIGYASVYFMFPRNINEKTFFFPYSARKWGPLETIAHEMLHFIFFAYIQERYGVSEKDEFEGKHPKYVWQVSETFNNVIENWKPYKDIFGSKEKSRPYPGCEKMFAAMTKQWEKKPEIENFLDGWLSKKNF